MTEDIRKKFKGDQATQQMRQHAEDVGAETIWDREAKQDPHCGFGTLGLCCKNCNLGPCRIDPFGEGATKGVCGADADVIAARNLLRHIAAGSSCHNDHGREFVRTLKLVAEGKNEFYKIKSPEKLKTFAQEYKIKTDGRDIKEIALDLVNKMYAEFGQQEGEITLVKRAPEKTRKIWKKYGLIPRGIDREITEA